MDDDDGLALTLATARSRRRSVTIPAAVEKVAQAQITRDTLEAPIRFLADDLLEGRGPATRGDQLARLYLSRELQSLGYQPGARERPTGSSPSISSASTRRRRKQWTFTGKGGNVDLKFYDDYTGSSGVQTPDRSGSRMRMSSSSAMASRRPSTSGTTSRAST